MVQQLCRNMLSKAWSVCIQYICTLSDVATELSGPTHTLRTAVARQLDPSEISEIAPQPDSTSSYVFEVWKDGKIGPHGGHEHHASYEELLAMSRVCLRHQDLFLVTC